MLKSHLFSHIQDGHYYYYCIIAGNNNTIYKTLLIYEV